MPAEGVVLIGVDLELQRRMAERIAFQPSAAPSDACAEPNIGAPKTGARSVESELDPYEIITGAPNFSAPPPFSGPDISASSSVEAPTTRVSHETIETRHTTHQPVNDREPKIGAPEFNLRDLLTRRTPTKTYTVHPVSRIEDVFTSAERDLLRWLWEKGRPVPMTPRIRLVTGSNGEGARRLAAQAGVIYNTFKNLTRSLATKFALDIVKPEKNLPAIYAVYHYSAILERQRQAGFTGTVHKNGGGRELVNAQGQPAPSRPDLTVDDLEEFLSALKSGAPTSIVDALFERTAQTDTEAARMIAKGCTETNPGIRPEEIARLIRTAQIPPSISNPVGLLIRALPSRCTPESISNYREQWRREEAEENRRREQQRAQTLETAKSILEAVSKGEEWDSSTIDWAKGILAEEVDAVDATTL